MTSLRSRVVRAATAAYFSRVDAHNANVQVMRHRLHAFANVLRTARGVTVEPREVAGLNAESLLPVRAPADRLLLYLHGGAYLMGGCATHRQMVSHIARASGVRTLLPEYRLAPEHPFPAAIDDAVRLYRSLLHAGMAARNIVIAGDSAGGGLAMATLLSLRDAGEPLPAAACLISPWLDLTGGGDSMTERAAHDPWFRPEDMPVIARYYCRDDQVRHPLVSPVFANLEGLPPLFVQVGEDEILLSDSTRIADNVRQAGGQVSLEVWPGMWHVFQAFVHYVPEARKAVANIGSYVRNVLGMAEQPSDRMQA
jgi:acetyl esterase/lipase